MTTALTIVKPLTSQIMTRFFDKVDISNNCWLWTGALAMGYGVFWLNGRNIGAHRFI